MAVIICSFNLNTLPKMSYGVLECDIVMLRAYDCVIKKGHYLCWTLYFLHCRKFYWTQKQGFKTQLCEFR